MTKQRRGKKAIKGKRRSSAKKEKEPRPEWIAAYKAKRAAAKMAGVGDLAKALGIGINQAYELVAGDHPRVPRQYFGKRYLIAWQTIDKIVSGELVIPEKGETARKAIPCAATPAVTPLRN
jgi:hypothetical protein